MNWRMPSAKGDNSNYYKILGVFKTSSENEIKKAYKRAALINHPDKGGDAEKFKEIGKAYDVLSDPKKRNVYDRCGEDPFMKEMNKGGRGDDFMGNNMPPRYTGGRGRPRRKGEYIPKKKGDNIVLQLKVSLEMFYNGTTKKMSLTRNVICSNCKGQPGRCEPCKGRKVVEETKELEIHIEKGMWRGQRITIKGHAHESPGQPPGDLVFVLQQKPHPNFRRNGDDLFVEHTLSLREALCGFQFTLTHLDGRKLLVKSTPGQIIEPGDRKATNHEGMPYYGSPSMKGRLYIKFSVAFPKNGTLSLDQIKTIGAGFPPSEQESEMELDECEEITLHDVNNDEVKSDEEATESDNDEDREKSYDFRRGCSQQ